MQRIVTAALACLLVAATAAQSAPRGRSDSPEQAAGAGNKVVCKTFTRTGTLADRYRTCKTKAEWEAERQNLRDLDRSYGCRQDDEHAQPCK
jgi:hypothetical protein